MPHRDHRSNQRRGLLAFTLLELLVVIAIIATLSGMILATGALNRDKAGLRVADAARGVERKLLEARNLAITKGTPHAVVFHIENAGMGLVLRNGDGSDARSFPGRHWCAVIGCFDPVMDSLGRPEDLPRIGGHDMIDRVGNFGSAQRFAGTIEKYQIGERYYLPRGTRFLALGDAEDNLHNTAGAGLTIPTSQPFYEINDWSMGTNLRTMGVANPLYDTYPRPWFGFLSGPGGVGSGPPWTLNAWGGYDTAIFGSGLDYECTNRYASGAALAAAVPIVNSKNDAFLLCTCFEETGRPQTPALNDLGEETRPCCDFRQLDKPRPVINGYWQDFMVVFMPTGRAHGVSFFNRGHLFSKMTMATGGSDVLAPITGGAPGYIDYGVPNDGAVTGQAADSPRRPRFYGRDDAIIHFENSVLGGTSITIAKDAMPRNDNATFESADAALQSLLPVRRVVVNDITGGVQVFKPYANIQRWLDHQERGVPASERIWGNGWLYCTAAEAMDPSVPNKIRVSGALTADMLLKHDPYPWIKPKP